MFIKVLFLFGYYDEIVGDQMQQKFNQCDICIIYRPSPLLVKLKKKLELAVQLNAP